MKRHYWLKKKQKTCAAALLAISVSASGLTVGTWESQAEESTSNVLNASDDSSKSADTTLGSGGTNTSDTPQDQSESSVSDTPKVESGSDVSDAPKVENGSDTSGAPKVESEPSAPITPEGPSVPITPEGPSAPITPEGPSVPITPEGSVLNQEKPWQKDHFEIKDNKILTGLNKSGHAFLEENKGKLVIPEELGITTIARGAFQGNQVLTSVQLPSTVTTIESDAFRDASHLKEAVWTDALNRIEDRAFMNCALTGELKFRDGFSWIGFNAFQGNKLKKVVFPDDIKTVGPYAFANNEIEEVHLGALKNITGSRWEAELNIEIRGLLSYGLFQDNKIKSLELPGKEDGTSLWGIGVAAFKNNEIEGTLTIPPNVQNIYFAVFRNNLIEEVIFESEEVNGIKQGTQQIDRNAFRNCKIRKITFPDTVNEIGGLVFAENQLTEVKIPNINILGYYTFAWNPLETVEFTNYQFYRNFPQPAVFSGVYEKYKEEKIPLKNVAFGRKLFNTEASTNFFSEEMFRNGSLKSIEIPEFINKVRQDVFKGNDGWYEGTNKVALYRKNQDGKYVTNNEVEDGEDYVFNPILVDIQFFDESENKELSIPEKVKIQRKRIKQQEGKPSEQLDIDLSGNFNGPDYENFKLGDILTYEIPEQIEQDGDKYELDKVIGSGNEEIKPDSTSSQEGKDESSAESQSGHGSRRMAAPSVMRNYTVKFDPDDEAVSKNIIEEGNYGESSGYKIGYKKATIEVRYKKKVELPSTPPTPKPPVPTPEPPVPTPEPPVPTPEPPVPTPEPPVPTPEPPVPTPEPPAPTPEPPAPPSGGGGSITPEPSIDDPEEPEEPTVPQVNPPIDVPVPERIPPVLETVNEEEVPLGPAVVDDNKNQTAFIEEEATPLGTAKVDNNTLEIADEKTPLGAPTLPKTGGVAREIPMGLGALSLMLGWILGRKKD